MRATMMSTPLTITPILRRAARLFGDVEIVSRRPDRSLDRRTYRDFVDASARLAGALTKIGLRPGDRVATLMWNHLEHVATYFGVPCAGGVLHTLNLRLHPDEIAYIANHAQDRFLIVDDVLLPLYAKFAAQVSFEKVIVVGDRKAVTGAQLAWDDLLASAPPDLDALPDLDENAPLGMCYTSGTTGKPKGVVYSHRSTVLHSMAVSMVDSIGMSQRDVILPVVPMFHANAWGIPYAAVSAGTKLVMPGPFLDPPSLLELMEGERVTCAAGVPTIWSGILECLEKEKRNLVPGCRMVVGGSAAPEAMIRKFDAFGLRVLHAWGMTETSPLGSVAYLRATDSPTVDASYAARARQGYPVANIEIRAVGEHGEIPWDDLAQGELHVRGPWVASSYHERPDADDRWTPDGWFMTGDVVAISPHGSIRIVDRSKDVIKSGGEWISSVDLENALVAHPAVREAAVIAVPHPKWAERPLAVVVKKDGVEVSGDELRAFLGTRFAKFQVPDAVVFIDAIPKTSTGKLLKAALRDKYAGWQW
jgi:fatty-acyl-CoA synthase